MAAKNALAHEKAYDAGQAAKMRGLSEDVNPFDPDTDEFDSWVQGFDDDLADKWTQPAAVVHSVEVKS